MTTSILIHKSSENMAKTERIEARSTKKSYSKSFKIGSASHNRGNGYPFISYGNGRYQQIYSAATFSHPLYISQLSFFNTEFFPGTAIISTANYKIQLSTTQRQVNQLSANFDKNLGHDLKTFFDGILSGNTGSKFEISGSDSFFYDPAKGNLLLDIIVSKNQNNGSGLLDIDTTGTVISCTAYGSTDSIGLITEFSGSIQPRCVPSFTDSLGLSSLNFLGAGLLLRRKTPQNLTA